MSRSNPNTQNLNPATRFFEWNGEHGNVSYYDKIEKKKIAIQLPFIFLVLDTLSTVKGWSEGLKQGIYSNEVRNTLEEPLSVKVFDTIKPIAEGFYREIRDKVIVAGGHFVSSIYIAYKDDEGKLVLANIQFKGAGLNAWVEFSSKKRNEIDNGAVVINGRKEGKKGSIKFFTPTFQIIKVSEETNKAAFDIDVELQKYLTSYLARKKKTVVEEVEQENQEPVKTLSADEEREIYFARKNKDNEAAKRNSTSAQTTKRDYVANIMDDENSFDNETLEPNDGLDLPF